MMSLQTLAVKVVTHLKVSYLESSLVLQPRSSVMIFLLHSHFYLISQDDNNEDRSGCRTGRLQALLSSFSDWETLVTSLQLAVIGNCLNQS